MFNYQYAITIFLIVKNKIVIIKFANEILIIKKNVTIENFIVNKKKRYKNTNLLKTTIN